MTRLSMRPGSIFERAVTRLLMKPATITRVSAISENFRLIELRGDELKSAAWEPGNKVQVKIDVGLTTRTFTRLNGTVS
jgi:NAD(P)H-flavin reductase